MRGARIMMGVVAAVLAASTAQGQLIVAFDDTVAGVTTAWEIRVADGSNVATPLFSGVDVWGIAADEANRKLWIASGTEMYSWSYDGGAPTLTGTFTFGGAGQAMVGLSFADGKLYGVKNVANEAIYEISTIDGSMTIVNDYTDGDYDFGGFDYDGLTGKHYLTNDDTSPHGNGLFALESSGSFTRLVGFPPGRTDIDGLAMGGGRAYLVEDEPTPIRVYNVVSGLFESDVPNPMTTSEVFSAGAWAPGLVPAPASVALIGLAGLTAGRRRR